LQQEKSQFQAAMKVGKGAKYTTFAGGEYKLINRIKRQEKTEE